MAKTQDEALVELNNKLNIENKALETKVVELNEAHKKKDEELNAAVKAAKDEKAKVEEKEKEIKKAKEEKEKADVELNSLKDFKQNAENEKLKSELNQDLNKYTEKEKSVAKEKIELFSKSPSLELKTQILSEINSSIAQSFIAQRQKNQSTETNSTNDKDIFSEINDAGQESSVSINDLIKIK
ncbi:hypothetical protein NSA31_04750 [Bacillus subtilis]|uniref:hypothetical protein n=1 Tax=Bacillus subtilis TaxID=1423 RepID=UPI00214A39E2|nr:hypothetical protein [Bacillus subtilis]MCR1991100.1 hypothetical protein [Bacillus subtilis]